MSLFDKGDIIRVELDPTVGKEIRGEFRTVLVLTPREINKLGLTLVAAISQGAAHPRVAGLCAPLSGLQTQGVVVLNQVRALDLKVRKCKFVEKADVGLIDEVEAIIYGMLDL